MLFLQKQFFHFNKFINNPPQIEYYLLISFRLSKFWFVIKFLLIKILHDGRLVAMESYMDLNQIIHTSTPLFATFFWQRSWAFGLMQRQSTFTRSWEKSEKRNKQLTTSRTYRQMRQSHLLNIKATMTYNFRSCSHGTLFSPISKACYSSKSHSTSRRFSVSTRIFQAHFQSDNSKQNFVYFCFALSQLRDLFRKYLKVIAAATG